MITFSLVRDLLHERFPEARNKTSRACQRRINYIMKNPTTEDNVAIFLEEVRQDANIVAEYKASNVQRDMGFFFCRIQMIRSYFFRLKKLFRHLPVSHFHIHRNRVELGLPDRRLQHTFSLGHAVML